MLSGQCGGVADIQPYRYRAVGPWRGQARTTHKAEEGDTKGCPADLSHDTPNTTLSYSIRSCWRAKRDLNLVMGKVDMCFIREIWNVRYGFIEEVMRKQ